MDLQTKLMEANQMAKIMSSMMARQPQTVVRTLGTS